MLLIGSKILNQMNKYLILFCFVILIAESGSSQPISVSTVTSSNTTLIQELLGNACTTIFDINYVGDPLSFGHFSTNSNNFALNEGLVLSNGRVIDIPGPNNSGGITSNTLGGTDPLLSTLVTIAINDAARLEYSFQSYLNEYTINFIYGSEEYPDFASYIDPMGIFVSGPNPAGGNYVNENIAVIPGSAIPINVSTIGPVTNNQYYINNGNGSSPSNEAIEFDGYTTVFTSSFAVIPGEIYDVVIVIADGNDSSFDSGVMFVSDTTAVLPVSYHFEFVSIYGVGQQLYEGTTANLMIVRNDSSTINQDIPVNLDFSGSAVPGQDYLQIPSSLLLPAGQFFINIPIFVYYDNFTELNEFLTISGISVCNQNSTQIQLPLLDEYIFHAGITVDTILNCTPFLTVSTFANSADSLVTYQWNTGNISPYLTYYSTVSYSDVFTVTITHDNGSQVIDSVYVFNSVNLNIDLATAEDSCFYGSVLSVVQGGIPPYNYIWSNGLTSENLIYAYPDNYSVTVTDSINCIISDSTTLYSLPPLYIVFSPYASCTDTINLIDAYGVFGHPPYSYLWSTGDTINQLTNINSGYYSLTLTDSYGCQVTDSVLYVSTQILSANLEFISDGCFGGVTTVDILSGNPPYNISWSNGITNEYTIQVYQSGEYWVYITDANSCIFTDTVNVYIDPDAEITITQSVSYLVCNSDPGFIDITIETGYGPFDIQWSNGDTITSLSWLPVGEYSVTITDVNGCSETWDYYISGIDSFTAEIIGTNITDCNNMNNGSATVYCAGGLPPYNYSWDNGSTGQTAYNLDSTLHYVTASDQCGTQSILSFNPVYHKLLDLDTILSFSSCSNLYSGSIEIVDLNNNPFTSTLFDMYNYQIVSPYQDYYSGLFPQDYMLFVADSYLCQDTLIINLSPEQIGLTANITPAAYYCNNDSVVLSVEFTDLNLVTEYDIETLPLVQYPDTGVEVFFLVDDQYNGPYPLGFDFSFFGENVSNFYIGSNGWISFEPLSSPINDPWVPHAVPESDPARPRNAILAAYKDWDPSSSGKIRYLTIGDFPDRMLIINFDSIPLFGCTGLKGSFQVAIHERTNIVDVSFINVPYCLSWNFGKGVSGIQNKTGNIAYFLPDLNNTAWEANNYTIRYIPNNCQWFFNNSLIGSGSPIYTDIDTTGYFKCTFTSCYGEFSDSVFVEVSDYIPDINFGNIANICVGEALSLPYDSSLSYSWNNGIQTSEIYPDTSGQYILEVTNGNCSISDSIIISVESANLLPVYDPSYCNSDTSLVSFDPTYHYIWQNGETGNEIYIVSTGLYNVTVSTTNCIFEEEIDLILANYPFSILDSEISTCSELIALNPGIADEYLWSNGLLTQEIIVVQNGIYTVTMSNGPCEESDSVTITFLPAPDVDLGDDTTICAGEILTLNPGVYTSYLWNNGSTDQIMNVNISGYYYVSVSNEFNCSASDSVWVEILYPPISSFSFDEAFGTVQFYNESQFATIFSWDFGDGSALDSIENPLHYYPSLSNNEYYLVTLTAGNQCGEDYSQFEILIFSVSDYSSESGFLIYPNPTNGYLVIKSEAGSNAIISLRNSLGQVLINQSISEIYNYMDLSIYPDGVYFLKIEIEGEIISYKIILNRH